MGFALGMALLAVFEEVVDHSLELVGFAHCDADVVADHQAGQLSAVDKDEAYRDLLCKLVGAAAEPARCDEYAAAGLRALQRADERLHLWALNGCGAVVPLGLNANQIEAESVLPDDPVQAAVAGLAGVVSRASRPP
jgi:hypothetical protein